MNHLNFKMIITNEQRDFFVKHLNLMNNQVYYFLRKINSHSIFHWLDNNEMAILLYKQGIRELEKAVNLNIDPNGKQC